MKGDIGGTVTDAITSPSRASFLDLASAAARDRDLQFVVLIFGLAALLPLGLGSYEVNVATTLFMYLALAQSWNLIGGYAGLISLAHSAFFGIGAIGATILLINGVPLALALLGALGCSLVVALIVGLPTLRLRGHYFVVATLLVSEVVRNFVLNLNAFNFYGGISVNITRFVGLTTLGPDEYNRIFFYLMLALAFVAMLVVLAIERSRWGYALRGIRDSEVAASALGVAATRVKISAFVLSAAFASVAGTIWAYWLGTVEANEAFDLIITFEVIVMVFLGGKGTLWGPFLGVVIVLLLNETVGVEFAEFTYVISGLIVVLVILFQPDGIIRLRREAIRASLLHRLYANLQRYRVK